MASLILSYSRAKKKNNNNNKPNHSVPYYFVLPGCCNYVT